MTLPLLASRIAFPASTALIDPRDAEASAAVVGVVARPDGCLSPLWNFRLVMASGVAAPGTAGIDAQYSIKSTNCTACEGGSGLTASSFGQYCTERRSSRAC